MPISLASRIVLNLAVVAVCSLAVPHSSLWAEDAISFRTQIAPLLLEHCASCHGPKKAEGGYRVDSFAQLTLAGDSGVLPLDSQKGKTELVRRLTTEDADERMPAQRAALPGDIIALFEKWQAQGGKFDGTDKQASLFDIVPTATYGPAPATYAIAIPITAVTFTLDGSQIIASGYHELTVWDATSGELKRRVENLPQRIHALEWSPDGKQLAVAGGSPGRIGEVRIVDWESGKVVNSFGRANDVVQSLKFQPGGKLLATGNTDGTLRWFDAQSGQMVRNLAGHADSIGAVAWSHDGKRIASASRDKTAKVFEIESGELLATYSGHGEPVTGICFHEGDKELTSVGGDKKAHRWLLEEAKRQAAVATPDRVTRLLESGSKVWLGLTDRTVRQLELAGTKLTLQLDGHTDWVTSLGLHAESKRLVSGGLNGELRVWNAEDGKPLKNWIAAPGSQVGS